MAPIDIGCASKFDGGINPRHMPLAHMLHEELGHLDDGFYVVSAEDPRYQLEVTYDGGFDYSAENSRQALAELQAILVALGWTAALAELEVPVLLLGSAA